MALQTMFKRILMLVTALVIASSVSATGKVQIGYLTQYGSLAPDNVVVGTLSHINYAFADINTNGTVFLTTPATDKANLQSLYQIKLKQRNLKVLLSIGGGTASGAGHFNFVTDSGSRANFVTSVVSDLDYEYPTTTAEGAGFADLFTELRTAFTTLQKTNGETEPYQLTAAINAVNYNNKFFVVPQSDAALTYWNIMGYDYSGSWIKWTDNQANIYGGARTATSGDMCVDHLTSEGATLDKIVMGIPLYGRSFEGTTGLGATYTGVGPNDGTYPYNQLPLAGATVSENKTDITSYSYDSSTREFVSYDTAAVGTLKGQYILSKGLAGSMFWELSSDRVGANSLVGTVATALGTLDNTQNHIKYPHLSFPSKRSTKMVKSRQ
ncbi:glycoside hydrolase family 18 protein [Athelia psychrophila]|uniref:Glycoside hydrolase family 18 protein n=1 Tax=Athelia psychrophila TaxID=1759441 RepID=A0A166H497_9AGAM|nr:glycoside hydrolase family 18 protein [Fibularhizoctonia sp. CBS 109695]